VNQPFHAILPDNPFSVIRETSGPDGDISYMPILQFWTWRTELHVTARSNDKSSAKPGRDLRYFDIADKMGDWRGSVVLNENWIGDRDGSLFQFIAISDAKKFTKEECLT
jgi:hypothetical protein